MAGADKDRHLVQMEGFKVPRAPLQRLDLLAHPARFLLAVPVADQANLLAARLLGPQRLAQPLPVPGDQAAGPQGYAASTIVLLQPHHHGARKILLEPQDVAHLGARQP